MVQSLLKLTPNEVQSLPIDRLGILVLKHLVGANEWSSYNFLNYGDRKSVV